MKPGEKTLEIIQGSTFDPTVRWKAAGVVVDLTGCTAALQLRARLSADTPLFTLSSANGKLTIPDPTSGEMLLLITAAESSAFTWSRAVYDLEVTHPGGRVERILEGAVRVSDEVTR